MSSSHFCLGLTINNGLAPSKPTLGDTAVIEISRKTLFADDAFIAARVRALVIAPPPNASTPSQSLSASITILSSTNRK